MSNYINSFLQTEITCIPRIINRYAGKYFSNTLCNAAVWLLCIWFLFHALFDCTLEAILRKLKYSGFVRERLKHSLWYIGFHSTSVLYCVVTLFVYKLEIFNSQRNYTLSDNEYIPSQLILGFLLLSTYYIHACIWELWFIGLNSIAINYFLLSCFMTHVYLIRWLELTFSVAIIISIQQLMLETSRVVLLSKTWITSYIFEFLHHCILKTTFYGLITVNMLTHLILLPLYFIIPIGNSLLQRKETLLLIINIILWIWIAIEIYISPSLRLMQHYICHVNGSELKNDCSNYIECVLFAPRSDTMFNIQVMKSEIRDRKAKLDKKKRPKKNAMLVQTIKCVMAIKRKLNKQQIVSEKAAGAAKVQVENNCSETEQTSNDVQIPNKFVYSIEDNFSAETDNSVATSQSSEKLCAE